MNIDKVHLGLFTKLVFYLYFSGKEIEIQTYVHAHMCMYTQTHTHSYFCLLNQNILDLICKLAKLDHSLIYLKKMCIGIMFIPEYKGNQTKIPVLSMGYFLLRFWLRIFQSSTNQQRSLLLVNHKNLMVRCCLLLKNITLVILLGETKLILTLKCLSCWVAFKKLGGTL